MHLLWHFHLLKKTFWNCQSYFFFILLHFIVIKEKNSFQFDLQLWLCCILLNKINFPKTVPFSVAVMEGEGPELLWLSHGSALSAHCVCCRQQTQKMWSEMRREKKNRQTEWESSRWDDIMCTAAKLQPHRNKGLHSCKAMPRAHRMWLLDVYCFSYTYMHIATLVPNILFSKCCCHFRSIGFHSWFLSQTFWFQSFNSYPIKHPVLCKIYFSIVF